MIRSYPKVYNLGHAAIEELLLDDGASRQRLGCDVMLLKAPWL